MTTLFKVGTSDPPWHCQDQLPGAGRGATKHYSTLSSRQLALLPRIGDPCDDCAGLGYLTRNGDWALDGRGNRRLCRGASRRHHKYCDGGRISIPLSFRFPKFADDSIHFMWRLGAMQVDATDILKAWNFTPKSELVWVKYRPCKDCRGAGGGVHLINGRRRRRWVCELCEGTGCGTPWFGMGRYTRNAHETCVIATRGKMASKILDHSIPSTLHAPMPWNWETNRPYHSAKPEVFYSLVERLARGPYVEMFGRRRRSGWTVLGNQVGKLQRVA